MTDNPANVRVVTEITRPKEALWEAGGVNIVYDPHSDGQPDPGEIVWTWVPYEDDPTQGKDRPVLIVAREGDMLIALMMTSKDHDFDEEDEARKGRFWFDIGTGTWDNKGRPSEVRLNRLIPVAPADVRREGAVLDQPRFEALAVALTPYLP